MHTAEVASLILKPSSTPTSEGREAVQEPAAEPPVAIVRMKRATVSTDRNIACSIKREQLVFR